jgi:hypothetical protein
MIQAISPCFAHHLGLMVKSVPHAHHLGLRHKMEDERHIKEEHHIRKEHQTRDIMEEEHHMIHIEDHHMDIYICMESEL